MNISKNNINVPGASRSALVNDAAKGDDTAVAIPAAAMPPRRARRPKEQRSKMLEMAAPTPTEDPVLNATTPAVDTAVARAPAASKLNRLLSLLRRPDGAMITELMAATGWQAHSVRGAIAGALRKKGHTVISEKKAGEERRYRLQEAP
jgi:hypothetical protein